MFDLAIGTVGLGEQAARAAGLSVETAFVQRAHHADYYPGSTPLRIKLIYESPSGRVLGAQVLGANGVDKRLDVIASVLHFGGTVHDLCQLDLSCENGSFHCFRCET